MTNTVSNARDLNFEKVSNPRILGVPPEYKFPLNIALTNT